MQGCQCQPCKDDGPHWSDCAVHGVDTEDGIKHLDCTCYTICPVCEEAVLEWKDVEETTMRCPKCWAEFVEFIGGGDAG